MTYADIAWKERSSAISFGKTFVQSEAFRNLFREGMLLVEDAAAYLDGPGRDEAKKLERIVALSYASESMRLTTRLMQIASWLLVQRAVAEGEITPHQALQEKNRVKLNSQDKGSLAVAEFSQLPEKLRNLIEQSKRLHQRIVHLDGVISNEQPLAILPESPVAVQQWLVQNAFAH